MFEVYYAGLSHIKHKHNIAWSKAIITNGENSCGNHSVTHCSGFLIGLEAQKIDPQSDPQDLCPMAFHY